MTTKQIIDNIYPFMFSEEISYSERVMKRGKQTGTCWTMLSKEEEDIIDNIYNYDKTNTKA